MIQVIRHGKGTMGRVVQRGQPIKYANNLQPLPSAAAPLVAKNKGKRK